MSGAGEERDDSTGSGGLLGALVGAAAVLALLGALSVFLGRSGEPQQGPPAAAALPVSGAPIVLAPSGEPTRYTASALPEAGAVALEIPLDERALAHGEALWTRLYDSNANRLELRGHVDREAARLRLDVGARWLARRGQFVAELRADGRREALQRIIFHGD